MTDVVQLPVLNETMIFRLAREVARNITPLADILKNYRLTQEQFDRVLDSPIFENRLREEVSIWNASDPMSAQGRIGVKALTMIEESMAEVYALIHDKEQPMSSKIEALKWASRMAGIGENASVKGADEDSRIKITINIGDQKVQFDKERVLPGRVTDAEVVTLTQEQGR